MDQCLVTGADGFIGRHLMAAGERFQQQLGASLLAAPAELDICDAASVTAQVAAVTDVEPGEWFDPKFLEQLRAASARVTLAPNDKKVLDLRLGGGGV